MGSTRDFWGLDSHVSEWVGGARGRGVFKGGFLPLFLFFLFYIHPWVLSTSTTTITTTTTATAAANTSPSSPFVYYPSLPHNIYLTFSLDVKTSLSLSHIHYIHTYISYHIPSLILLILRIPLDLSSKLKALLSFKGQAKLGVNAFRIPIFSS